MPHLFRPALLLRIEYVALLILTVGIYWDRGESWLLLAVLLLAPDLSFVAAVAGTAWGISRTTWRTRRSAP